MTDNTAKIIDRVQKLKAHAESAQRLGSEAEAQAFAAMFQKLMTDHRLEMTDLELAQFEREQPVIIHYIDYTNYPDLKRTRRRSEWMETLGDIVARAHFCRILNHPGSNRISFAGRENDVKVAEYMFVTLVRSLQKLADDEYAKYSIQCVNECELCGRAKAAHTKRGDTLYCRDGGFFEPNWAKCRGFRPSYMTAFIRRLAQRYQEERRRAEANTTALVRLRNADRAAEDFVNGKDDKGKDRFKTSGALSTTVITNREGFVRGRAAAEQINLDPNAIENKDQPKLRR